MVLDRKLYDNQALFSTIQHQSTSYRVSKRDEFNNVERCRMETLKPFGRHLQRVIVSLLDVLCSDFKVRPGLLEVEL